MEPIKVRRINYTFNYNHKILTQKDLQDEDKPSHPLNREKLANLTFFVRYLLTCNDEYPFHLIDVPQVHPFDTVTRFWNDWLD